MIIYAKNFFFIFFLFSNFVRYSFSLEYEISKKQGNFLIPIGRTGYISKELWRELLDEKQDDHTFDIYRCDIESLGDDTKTLDEVMEIVIELIKKVK
jgi:hypothetical protein